MVPRLTVIILHNCDFFIILYAAHYVSRYNNIDLTVIPAISQQYIYLNKTISMLQHGEPAVSLYFVVKQNGKPHCSFVVIALYFVVKQCLCLIRWIESSHNPLLLCTGELGFVHVIVAVALVRFRQRPPPSELTERLQWPRLHQHVVKARRLLQRTVEHLRSGAVEHDGLT